MAGEVLEPMGLASAFNVQLHVPALTAPEVEAVMRHEEAFTEAEIPEVRHARTICVMCSRWHGGGS
jgi:hypothetical protein